MTMRNAIAPLLLLSLATSGCAHWGTNTVYGDRREVGRRLLGSPQIAETTISTSSAGFTGYRSSAGAGTDLAAGNLSSKSGSQKLTHCVQRAEVDYLRPYTLEPVVEGRGNDLAGAIALAAAGSLFLGEVWRGNHGCNHCSGAFYGKTREGDVAPTGSVIGLSLIGAGIGWGAYSYAALPSAAPPAVRAGEARFTETELVESSGCGLVPGDNVAPAATSAAPAPTLAPVKSAADRIRELDGLQKSGAINDTEYQTRKKAILDSI